MCVWDSCQGGYGYAACSTCDAMNEREIVYTLVYVSLSKKAGGYSLYSLVYEFHGSGGFGTFGGYKS